MTGEFKIGDRVKFICQRYKSLDGQLATVIKRAGFCDGGIFAELDNPEAVPNIFCYAPLVRLGLDIDAEVVDDTVQEEYLGEW